MSKLGFTELVKRGLMQKREADYAVLQQQMQLEKLKMDLELEKMSSMIGAQGAQGSYGMAQQQSPEYILRIRPGTNGGYAVWFDSEMFIAADAEELAKVVVTAIVRKKIKA